MFALKSISSSFIHRRSSCLLWSSLVVEEQQKNMTDLYEILENNKEELLFVS